MTDSLRKNINREGGVLVTLNKFGKGKLRKKIFCKLISWKKGRLFEIQKCLKLFCFKNCQEQKKYKKKPFLRSPENFPAMNT